MVLASADFSLVRHSWLRRGVSLASSDCWEANVVLASAVFFLANRLTQRQAEQSLEFLRDLGILPYVREAWSARQFSWCAIAFRERFFAFGRFFGSPRLLTAVSCRGLVGCRSRLEFHSQPQRGFVGRRAGGCWRLCEGLGSLPEQGPAAFCRAQSRRQGGGQGSTALRGAGPRSAGRRACGSLAWVCGAVLRCVAALGRARAFLMWKFGHYFCELQLADTRPRVHAIVYGC